VPLGTSWGNTSRRENVGKPFGKQIGDMVGTPKSQKLTLRPLNYPKGKNMDPSGCMLNHLIGCMEMLFLKLFVTIFDLG